MAKRRIRGWGKGKSGVVPTTHEGGLIMEVMAEAGVKGNYKDHVLILGGRMIDRSGTVDVQLLDDAPLSGHKIDIVHKRNLHLFIGEAARRYWVPGIGRVPPPRRSAR